MNANMKPGARIPRNALCVWQSDAYQAQTSGAELTKSLRRCIPQSPKLVHPLDWPTNTQPFDMNNDPEGWHLG